jgi:UDP-N-acetylglucosamine diphosphorylase/glucosamine-1-phosphate N-acetyltransferase
MKAVILAAGKGLRLRPITETRPKPLIPILCKPLLQWQLEALDNTGIIDEVVVVVSYLGDMIREFIDGLRLGNMRVRIVDQREELGTGDAVLKALKNTGLSDEKVLILYGDIFLRDWSIIREILAGENIVVGARVSNPSDYGVLVVENNYLRELIEKPVNPPTNIVNAGIYVFRADTILDHSDVKPSPRGEIEFTDIIMNIVRDNIPVKVYDLGMNKWIDIGKPWHILEANKLALENIEFMIKGIVEPGVSIHGRVFIGEDSRIRSGTYIEGPVFIGRDTVIGPNARIRPYSVICDGSKIGFSVEVKESLIMEHVHISHLSYVGDSIICEYVNFGAGTITANLRFDDKPVKIMIKDKLESSGRRKLGAVVGAHVKTGVNVSLMPGVKIGSYSWIAPGAVVYRDVPPRSFYKWFGIGYIEDLKQND